MRKLMKNPRLMLALALALCLVLSVTAYAYYRHSAGEELPDIHREAKARKVLEHPEEYPDLTVIVYDNAYDYIKAVKRDEALEPEERNALAGAAMTKEGIRYLKLRMEVPVEKGYCVYPSFYLRCAWEDGQPGEILAVEKAFLESVKAGSVKHISFTQRIDLQGGEYLLSLGVTGYENEDFKVYHRLYDVMDITVISDKNTVGYYDANSEITVTEE